MSDVVAYHVFVCALFPVQGGMWTDSAMICCHITHNNGILIVLMRDFSQEIYVLPDDDMRGAIETCKSSESVLM
jgi:hypothetical protein